MSVSSTENTGHTTATEKLSPEGHLHVMKHILKDVLLAGSFTHISFNFTTIPRKQTSSTVSSEKNSSSAKSR